MIMSLSATLLKTFAGWTDRWQSATADLQRVVHFLHQRQIFDSRESDIFVASYPRSGTTLLLNMVHLIVHRLDDSFEHIDQVAPWFERQLANRRASAADLNELADPRLFKTHLPAHWLPRRGRRIYVQRNVQDVMQSYFHFYQQVLGEPITASEFCRRFSRGALQYGDWWSHVASYQQNRDDPHLLQLNYEELVHQPAPQVEQIAAFSGRLPARRRCRPSCAKVSIRTDESRAATV